MTRKNKIINFEPQERLLVKAQKYIDDVALFLDDKQNAVPLLLRALKLADRRLKHKILLMLGGFAKQEIAWPLYQMMTDPHIELTYDIYKMIYGKLSPFGMGCHQNGIDIFS